jgi:hypothetical protein
MKSRTILLILVFFLATPLWMRLSWEILPARSLNLAIIDKTVVNTNSNEHRSVNWILDYEKYTRSDGSLYDISKDYYGFFPGDHERYTIHDFEKMDDGDLDSLTSVFDLVYFTDTYGVLGNEWYRHRDRNESSISIYGGLSEKDMLFLKMMKEKKKPIVTEFNTIAYPTTHDVRTDFENTFGIKWTGWMARYIASLDTVDNPDLPKSIVRKYKSEHGGAWNFTNEGMLFIHEDGRILVLEKGRGLNDAIPKIYTDKKFQSRFSLPLKIIYPYLIDIISNRDSSNQIVSSYYIETTSEGEKILSANGIPKSFPCIIHREKDYSFYYFCGDFADNPTKFRFAKLFGIRTLKFLMYNAIDVTDRNRFFWEYYLPLMQTIFKEAYNQRMLK